MTINVEENIKKARRSAYGLFSGGYRALQQFKTEIASLAFGRTHWAHNCVRFSPFKLLSVLPGFVYKRPRLDLVFCCCYFPSLLY
jgi:hypothetical protein